MPFGDPRSAPGRESTSHTRIVVESPSPRHLACKPLELPGLYNLRRVAAAISVSQARLPLEPFVACQCELDTSLHISRNARPSVDKTAEMQNFTVFLYTFFCYFDDER